MLKKLLFIGFAALGASCTYVQKNPICPNVIIEKGNDSLIQKAGGNGQFKIELTGYEGYCFYDEKVRQPKARITPLFRVHRLSNFDESDIHFSYYADTIQGPPQYLGKRFYNESVELPYGIRQKTFRGRPMETKVPYINGEGFKLALGLAAAREDSNNHTYHRQQSYTFSYELEPDDLRENSGSYAVVTDNYGTEMYYAAEAQQQLEASREAARLESFRRQEEYNRSLAEQRRQQSMMRRRVQYYNEPQPVAYSRQRSYGNPQQMAVREYSAAEIERFPRTTVQTVSQSIPVNSIAQGTKMNRQMRRRMNCKTCQE